MLFVKDVKLVQKSKLVVVKNLKMIDKMIVIVHHDLIEITFFALSGRDLIGDHIFPSDRDLIGVHENGDRPHLC